MAYQIGIDVGGTFTDFVVQRGDDPIWIGKTPSTPQNESEGVFDALRQIASHFDCDLESALGETDLLILGTTVVTNTMLEYTGARTGLITTKGFRDLIELRRAYRESLFDLKLPAPHPLVPRRYRRGVSERVDHLGNVVVPLDESDVLDAVKVFRDADIEAVAICLLFSFVNPDHERRIAEILREELPGMYVCSSHEVLPQIREFERVSTTIVNAYTTPKLSRYIDSLQQRLTQCDFGGRLFVMGSNGGIMDAAYFRTRGVEAVLSGPAGGIVASVMAAGLSGYQNVIGVDMGGTSYDVCLIKDSKPDIGVDNWISRYRIATPMIDIHTIGAGGGSIAWIDEGGGLRVGPQSAGSNPGPACYNRGGREPTVTDADLVLGYLSEDYFLGGRMQLSLENASRIIEEKIAKPLDLSLTEAANGIFRIVNNSMTNALRYVSVARGRDPRDYALIAYGGAGPVHVGAQVRDLGIRTILVPKTASVFSALGNLVSDFKISKVQSFVVRSDQIELDELNERFSIMTAEAEHLLEGVETSRVVVDRQLDIRYVGQVQEVTVPVHSRTRRITQVNLENTFQDFHERHQQLYAFKRPEHRLEILSLRLDLVGMRVGRAELESCPFADEDATAALKGERQVYFEAAGFQVTKIYDGERLRPGNLIAGPAVIEEPTTSVVVYPNQEALLDQYSTYVIEIVV